MAEENTKVLEGDIIEVKKKIVGLKKDIKDATGTEAGKIQKSAQGSIDKLSKELKDKESELGTLKLPEVTDKEVLEMIEFAATVEEVDEIEGSFEDEIPDDIKEVIENRRNELSAETKNLVQYPELRWKKASIEEVMKAQDEGRLVGHDPKKGIALIKPKKKQSNKENKDEE